MLYDINLDYIDLLMEKLDNQEMDSLMMMFNHSFLDNILLKMVMIYLQEISIIISFTLFNILFNSI